MQSRHVIVSFVAATCIAACAMASGSGWSPTEAAQHVGEHGTVCGRIASAHYAEGTDGQPTFINLDKPYPDQIFTIVIWGNYRDRFSVPPEIWHGRVCVTGRISAYHGEPEIAVTDPAQIEH